MKRIDSKANKFQLQHFLIPNRIFDTVTHACRGFGTSFHHQCSKFENLKSNHKLHTVCPCQYDTLTKQALRKHERKKPILKILKVL